jgi:restriction endonuclease
MNYEGEHDIVNMAVDMLVEEHMYSNDKDKFQEILNNKHEVINTIEKCIKETQELNNTDGIIWHAIMNTIKQDIEQIISSVRAHIKLLEDD